MRFQLLVDLCGLLQRSAHTESRRSARSHETVHRISRLVLTLTTAAAFASSAFAAPQANPWRPATPEELSASSSTLEPDAPAELLLWQIEVDDKNYPNDRKITEYRRYKIFVPEKAEHVLRIARTDESFGYIVQEKNELSARLTQPDGTIRELGKESILERELSKTRTDFPSEESHNLESVSTEKYLAVSGVEPGAILEVQITTIQNTADAITLRILQLDATPVRKLEYVFRAGNPKAYEHRFFGLNTAQATVSEDKKKHVCTLKATDLPGLVKEPFAGARADYALTAISCYTPYTMGTTTTTGDVPQTIDGKAGPWAVYASVFGWIEQGRTKPTSRVKKAVAALTQGATSDLEKAQRIHQRVQRTYLDFCRRAKNRSRHFSWGSAGASLDVVLDLGERLDEKLRVLDFLYLELSMYRAAGLRAELLLLPDREFARLDRRLASYAFLQDACAAVQIADTWYFSQPHRKTPSAFGDLHWSNQGQGGLLARPNKQDFIDVPLDDAAKNSVTNIGTFELDQQGALSGQFLRSLTGQPAAELRGKLIGENSERQNELLKEIYADTLKGAELTVIKIDELENPDLPLKITYKLEWPGYAVLTTDRLILRGAVFRAQSETPFTSATRRYQMIFPYRTQEFDRVTLRIPEGFEPESMAAPASSPGDVLSYKVAYAFEAPKRLVHTRRQFQSSVITVPVENYQGLKKWYDAVTDCDHHELVFVKAAPVANVSTP